MEGRAGFRITPRLVLGLGVIALGVVFMLGNLNLVDPDEILRYWPLVLIAVGLIKLVQPGAGPSRASGILFIAAGSLLLLTNFGVLHARIIWPVILMLVGAWIVFRSAAGGRASLSAADSSSTISSLAIMAGVERKNSSKEFKGGEATAIMGGCELDLREASIAGGDAVLDVFAMWGGIDIIVPGDWTVVNSVTPLMGGVEDSRKTVGSDPGKRLVVKGLAIMGGVEISN